MKKIFFIFMLLVIGMSAVHLYGQERQSVKTKKMEYNKLTKAEEAVLLHKATEPPYTGEYVNNHRKGIYVCRRCNAPLYKSDAKFDSHCGWPAFDQAIEGAVKRIPDADGRRTEIICANCGAHLGHVFTGEGFTPKDTRYCVNSISMKFIPDEDENLKTAYFSAGCFWGVEYYFMKAKGVVYTAVGFMGGHVSNPSYEEVCEENTGHLETVKVEYDENKTTYDELVKLFFEIHDFTQTNGQGPDIGEQYLSCIFYENGEQKKIAEKYMTILRDKGYKVATQLKPAMEFWKAEDYHQHYYEDRGTKPYCHIRRKLF